jgi:uncharacterized membrane protein YdbT with pleckstrin-like domain
MVKSKKKSKEDNFFEDTLEYAEKFHRKFRKQIVVSISAAFGFLIALSWREPISQLVDLMIKFSKLQGSEIYIQLISATVVTIISVLGIMIISKWDVKKDKQEEK